MNRERYQVIEQLPDGIQYITYQDKKPNIGEGRKNPWKSLDTKTGKITHFSQHIIDYYNKIAGHQELKLV